MIHIRRACSCLRFPSARYSRQRLYALFTFILILFSSMTLFLNFMPPSNLSGGVKFVSPVDWKHALPSDGNDLMLAGNLHSLYFNSSFGVYSTTANFPSTNMNSTHVIYSRTKGLPSTNMNSTHVIYSRTKGLPSTNMNSTHVIYSRTKGLPSTNMNSTHVIYSRTEGLPSTNMNSTLVTYSGTEGLPSTNMNSTLVTYSGTEGLPNTNMNSTSPVYAGADGRTNNRTVSERDKSNTEPPHMVWDTSLRYTDRVLEQLHYVPENINKSKLLNILVWEMAGQEQILYGREQFLKDKCLTRNCFIHALLDGSHVDALITSSTVNDLTLLWQDRKEKDVWIYYDLENPYSWMHSVPVPVTGFNWTATYRRDSTIVAPYEKWVPFANISGTDYFDGADLSEQVKVTRGKNYAFGKSKMAAALISNCHAEERLKVIKALSALIKVDVYGYCGLECYTDCFEIIRRDYKFYLAFENSNCIDYITEKFFRNALGNNALPVVFGAPPPSYFHVAPPYSYIHVDNFPSLQHLVRYLKVLDKNDDLYNFYFQWKGKGSFINTKFWCRLCALLNDLDKPTLIIHDLKKWWAEKTCKEHHL